MTRLLVAMIAHIDLDDRLSILRIGDPSGNWNSLDDQRLCVFCGRKFKGRQLVIRLGTEKTQIVLSNAGLPVYAASVALRQAGRSI